MLTICPNDKNKLVKFKEDGWEGVKCKECWFKWSKRIEREAEVR